MKIVYSPRAIVDPRAISAYLRPRSPQGAKHVRAAILDALAQLSLFPRAGTPQTTEGVRIG
jgi:plasmid stabilization system protein ParE